MLIQEGIDIEGLKLPSGDRAHLLTQPDLFWELSELGVEDITVHTGRTELLIAYGRFLKKSGAVKHNVLVVR